ncbi:HAAS signaling domain-containing protein [Kribbella sp. NPDC048928]|uniref:HAAS signaling domain-containing protein n=1 Tax=Kribbella sp. NPDC048928 TaxID=3364111 RepID=UPI0037114E25
MNVELDSDRLVDAYLNELATEAEVLPAGRRDELLADMKAHIAEARAGGATSEDEVREVLQRLGRPSEIVAAATDGLVQVEVPPRLRPQDFVAVGLLLVAPYLLGFSVIVAVAGWVIGLGMLWASNRWTTLWKLIGTLTWPIGYAVVVVLDTFFQAPIGLSLAADAVVTIALTAALVLNARAPRQAS